MAYFAYKKATDKHTVSSLLPPSLVLSVPGGWVVAGSATAQRSL